MNTSDFGMNGKDIPSYGRLIEYCEPHSPFQKLIDSQRKRCGLSGRELTERIGVSQSTLWIWLHNLNGFPHPKSFNSEHVRRLAEVLSISESEIKTALEASRPFDAFGRFIEILENDNRQTVSKPYVLNIAKNLYRCSK
jgi:transcriptional regulator with XRE-family HTH domain